MSVSILDRYLSVRRHTVKRADMALVAATSMYIACKYEEIFQPCIGN